MRIEKVRFLPEALVVLDALHEAARAVIAEMDEGSGGQEDPLVAAVWPAIVKYVGKAHCALLVANVLTRNALWRIGGVREDLPDPCARLLDALAASAKLCTSPKNSASNDSLWDFFADQPNPSRRINLPRISWPLPLAALKSCRDASS